MIIQKWLLSYSEDGLYSTLRNGSRPIPFETITSINIFSSVSAGIIPDRKWRRCRKLWDNLFSEHNFNFVHSESHLISSINKTYHLHTVLFSTEVITSMSTTNDMKWDTVVSKFCCHWWSLTFYRPIGCYIYWLDDNMNMQIIEIEGSNFLFFIHFLVVHINFFSFPF